MASYVWVNITDNHFKVWGFDLFSCDDGTGKTISYWGRIGLSMQQLNKKEKLFDSFGDAHGYMQSKIEEKFCKGYVAIPNWMYFQMIQSPRGIAALVNIVLKMESIYMRYYNSKELKKAS